MKAATDLVGPVPTVRFGGGPKPDGGWVERLQAMPAVAYEPPVNTLDPRYVACTEHRVACDCREAEFAEERHERILDRKHTQAVFDEILAGHGTRLISDTDGVAGCMCTGCQIARRIGIWPVCNQGGNS